MLCSLIQSVEIPKLTFTFIGMELIYKPLYFRPILLKELSVEGLDKTFMESSRE